MQRSQLANLCLRALAALLLCGAGARAAAPCLSTVAACTEWVNFPAGKSRSLVYRNYSLTEPNPAITRALVMVHGAGRDADGYFRTALAAAFLAGALDDTVVVSPRFASNDGRNCQDKLAAQEVSWSCNGDSWRSGGTALNDPALSSFDFADQLLRTLANKQLFPNLRAIVLAGHSAGGQFATRYEMANKIHEHLGIPVVYVVANPSSYAYLDSVRPTKTEADFQAFGDGRNCTTYNSWPYGLLKRSGYTEAIPDDTLKKQFASRPVTYLLGEIDILPLGGFDASCPAMAQGPTRLARGQAYAKYAATRFHAPHAVKVVPLCGHNARCMFTAESALPVLFPKNGSLAAGGQ